MYTEDQSSVEKSYRSTPEGSTSVIIKEEESSDVEVPMMNLGTGSGQDLQLVCELQKSLQSSETCSQLLCLDVIGCGSFWKVYRGIWRGTFVAAKVCALPLPGKKVWENEISIYKSFNHPNVLALLGVLFDTETVTLITNLVNGKDLHRIIFDDNKNMEMTFSMKTDVAQQVARALVFMHTATPPVIHLDLKPANILVEEKSMHVFLADFGLSKIMNECNVAGTTTMKAGTPGFQAPEQLRGEGISPKCDVYALGGVLTELYGEAPLWPKMSHHAIMFSVGLQGNIPHLSPEVQSIAKMCFTPVTERACASDLLLKLLSLKK